MKPATEEGLRDNARYLQYSRICDMPFFDFVRAYRNASKELRESQEDTAYRMNEVFDRREKEEG